MGDKNDREGPVKGTLINRGNPAPERHDVEGEVIQPRPRARVKLQGAKPPMRELNHSTEDFKVEIRNWLVAWEWVINDSYQLATRYLEIYRSLKETLIDREIALLEGFEPWQHFKQQILTLQFNPAKDIVLIKFCVLYLKAIYTDICTYLDDPRAGLNINRPTPPREEQRQEESQLDRVTKTRNRMEELRRRNEETRGPSEEERVQATKKREEEAKNKEQRIEGDPYGSGF